MGTTTAYPRRSSSCARNFRQASPARKRVEPLPQMRREFAENLICPLALVLDWHPLQGLLVGFDDLFRANQAMLRGQVEPWPLASPRKLWPSRTRHEMVPFVVWTVDRQIQGVFLPLRSR